METHAVPQEIMGVEFKLFGNFLSLREFIFIAVGLALAYFFYFLMQRGVLPGILAVPAILFFGLGGTLVGLVPIQERSLDKWIVNYFSAINRPTQRVWKKTGFSDQSATDSTGVVSKSHVVTPPIETQPSVFTAGTTDTPPKADSATIQVEKGESQEIQRINAVLTEIETGVPQTTTALQNTTAPTQTATQPAPAQSAPVTTETTQPQPTPAQPAPVTVETTQPSQPTPVPTVSPQPSPTPVEQQPTVQLQSQAIPIQQAPSTPPAQEETGEQINSNATSGPTMQQQVTTPSPAQTQEQPPAQAPTQTPSQTNPQQDNQTPQQPSPQKDTTSENNPEKQESQPHVLKIDDNDVKDYATSITGLTSKPNTINIVVKDSKGLILPGVVCVTKNPQGEPVRAAISNVLGQILNNVPLKNGTYRVSLSKQGYVFPDIIRTLKGKTYPPIEIQAL